jgi:CRP-like cAMP-binding protein
MSAMLDLLRDREVSRFAEGATVLREGQQTGRLYFLIEGRVEVLKSDVRVAVASEPGAVFGEMAMILGGPHTATVRALEPCSFYLVDNPSEFLGSSPVACLHVCQLLARRIDALNKYLVDVKHQYEGHDHLGMVDGILEALLHRPARQVVRPSDSTARHGELAD